MSRYPVRIVVLLFVVASAPGALHAGTVSLEWDPVTHPDLVGYRVHYGTSPDALDATLDVGEQTAATLTGLADCTTWYVGLTARGSGGAESPEMSALVSGWPRPVLASAAPAVLDRGTTVTVVLGGANFQPGATAEFGPGVAVDALAATGCSELVATVTVAPDAAVGPRTVAVVNPDAVFGEAPALIEVVIASDGEPPVLSAPQAVDVTGTAATIAWTTDEPADARVAYRRTGAAAWIDGPSDDSLATGHSLTLAGLTPETSYEYTVASADEAGNESVSAPASFTTAASPYDYLRFEAETPPPAAPIDAVEGAGAFRGGWLELLPGTPAGSPADPAGERALGVTLPRTASWHVWLRVLREPGSGGAWLAALDDGPFLTVAASATNEWEWVEASSGALASGRHTVTLGGGDTGARLDRVLVTDDPDFVPTEAPGADTTAPPPVAGAAVDAGDARATLSWTDPASADAERVVVRYLAGDAAPTSPVDGEPLFDGAVDPGVARELLHDGLANGEPVSWSIFVLDAAGNASGAVTLSATPQAPPPPLGTVQNLRRADRVGD